jgi:hypothetical protein
MGKRITDPVEQLAEKTAERVIDLVVRTLDVNAVVQRVDLNAIMDRVDMNKLVDQVDVDKILDQVDVDKILDQVDVDKLVDRVDLNKIRDQVDVDRLLAKVDLDELLARVDVDAVVDRVDINGIAQGVDGDAIAMHTDIGAMIARSSGGIAGDARGRGPQPGRRAGRVDRPLGRPPAAPPRRSRAAAAFRGCGVRFVAYVVDLGVSIGVFMLALAAISFAASIITGDSISWNRNDLPVAILFVVWEFVYFAYSWGRAARPWAWPCSGSRWWQPTGRRLARAAR